MNGRSPYRSAIGDSTSRGGPGQHPNPSLQRHVVLRRLQELRNQEQRSKQAGVHEEAHSVGGGEPCPAEQGQRQHRGPRPPLPPTDSPTRTAPAARAPITSPLDQPKVLAGTGPQVRPRKPAPARAAKMSS